MARRIALLTILLVASQDTVFGAEPEFRRWAIITAPELRETGIADLLTVKLSAESFELVERDELDRLTRELELSQLQGTAASADRLRLGQRVGADAMILLSRVTQEKSPAVRMVICDCVYGSRLLLEHFPQSTTNAESITEAAFQSVLQTRDRFRNGVERVIAVSPFLTKNLSHDFDYLQYAFSALLGQALSQNRGVAVLEIEEARAISSELQQSDSSIERRTVPLFIEGDFEVLKPLQTGNSTADARRITITLTARDSKTQLPPVSFLATSKAEAARWLTVTAPASFTNASSDPATNALSTPNQRRLLLERADRFSHVAAYEQSTALREAALLLTPENWEERLGLYNDYRSWAQIRHMEMSSPRFRTSEERKAELADEQFRFGRILTHHLEVVLTTAELNPLEISTLIKEHRHDRFMRYVPSKDRSLASEEAREFYWRHILRTRTADPLLREGMLHDQIRRHTPGLHKRDPRTQFQFIGGDAFYSLTIGIPFLSRFPDYDAKYLSTDIRRLLTEILPTDQINGSWLRKLTNSLQGSLPHLVRMGRMKPEDLEAVYEELTHSEDRVHRFYGELGLLGQRSLKLGTRPVSEDDVERIDNLLAAISRWRFDDPKRRHFTIEPARKALNDLKATVQKELTTGVLKKSHRLSPNNASGVDPAPRVIFEPISGVALSAKFLKAVNDDLDLLWNMEEVWLMAAPGKLRSIFRLSSKDDFIFHAACDGEFVWIASIEDGIQIFDLNGKLQGQFTPDGKSDQSPDSLPPLPRGPKISLDRIYFSYPFRRPVAFQPLSPGRCLISGQLGADKRCWFGEIIREPLSSTWRFKSWLEATAVASRDIVNDPVETSFEPSFLLPYRLPDRADLILAARPGPSNGNGIPKTVVAFDVKSGSASVLPGLALPRISSRIHEALQIGNDLVVANDGITRFTPPPGGLDGPWESHTIISRDQAKWRRTLSSGLWRNQLFLAGHRVVVPGQRWLTVDTRTWEFEFLNKDRVRPKYNFQHFGHSAHFGLVAWHTGETLHRVHLDESVSRDDLDKWQYGHVPVDKRVAHRKAVEALQRLGATVESQPPGYSLSWFGRGPSGNWVTTAYLSDEWKGGDRALRYLKGLHGLEDLLLVRAPVTDAGLKTIGELDDLKILSLEETKCTDAGLSHLTNLRSLRCIRLDGSGAEFSDAGLARLAGLTDLRKLIVFGPGFTDRTATLLMKWPGLVDVRLLQTAVSRNAIRAATSKRGTLRILTSNSSGTGLW